VEVYFDGVSCEMKKVTRRSLLFDKGQTVEKNLVPDGLIAVQEGLLASCTSGEAFR
jgi:hypothetical protein